MPAASLLPGGHGEHNRADQGGDAPWGASPRGQWPQPEPTVAWSKPVLLGVDDGVVAADAVGLEGLGGVGVVPAAALGEVAERESAPGGQGHYGAAGAVAAGS